MILGKDQKGDIAQRLDFIQVQLNDLKQFNNLDWKTYNANRDIQRNVERLVENVGNATIDICKIVLAGEDVEMPGNYKEIIIKLGTIGILNEELAIKIAEYARLRNLLAHQYLDIKWEKIKDFIANAVQNYQDFIHKIQAKIN